MCHSQQCLWIVIESGLDKWQEGKIKIVGILLGELYTRCCMCVDWLVWFGLVSLFNGISTFVAILLEEQ